MERGLETIPLTVFKPDEVQEPAGPFEPFQVDVSQTRFRSKGSKIVELLERLGKTQFIASMRPMAIDRAQSDIVSAEADVPTLRARVVIPVDPLTDGEVHVSNSSHHLYSFCRTPEYKGNPQITLRELLRVSQPPYLHQAYSGELSAALATVWWQGKAFGEGDQLILPASYCIHTDSRGYSIDVITVSYGPEATQVADPNAYYR